MALTLTEQSELDHLISKAQAHPIVGRDVKRLRELAIRQSPVASDHLALKLIGTALVLGGLFYLVRRIRRRQVAAVVVEAVDLPAY